MKTFKNENLGAVLRKLRSEKSLPLRIVAAFLDIDQAILSKIERERRNATREQVTRLADFFKVEKEYLLTLWLSDKILYEIRNEDSALKALQLAEEKISYYTFINTDRGKIIGLLKNEISNFQSIEKAWISGSFSRGDDRPGSDIDIAFKTNEEFSYFDLAEVKYKLEGAIKRKVDVGFIDSFKPYIFDHVKPDLKIIYER